MKTLLMGRGALIGAFVVLSCVACGEATEVADARFTSGDPMAIAEATQEDFESWAGSVQDLQAAAFLKAYEINGGYSKCLRDLGYEDDWEVAVGPIQPRYFFGQETALTGPDWRLSDAVLVNASIARNAWRLHVPAPLSRVDEENACREKFPGASDEELDQIAEPAVVSKLRREWESAIQEVGSSTLVDKDFYTCFENSTLAEPFSGKAPKQWFRILDEAEPNPSLIPVGDESPSKEWQQYRKLESVILGAAWDCRSDSYRAAVAKLPRLVESFDASHAAEIREARAHWTLVEARARELGWEPDRPQGLLKTIPSPTASD